MIDGDANDITYDLSALFSSDQRDFLIKNNGDQVKISSLVGKIVGIFFGSSETDHHGACPSRLLEIYEEVAVQKGDFEVVFVSCDPDNEGFNNYFAKMPWLAIPFPEAKDIWIRLRKWFMVRICGLVILDSNGKIGTEQGKTLVMWTFGADAYPFTRERFNFLKKQVEASKRNQSLTSLLVSRHRDYLLSNHGNHQVPVSKLVGKTVGLYFGNNYSDSRCPEFTSILLYVYNKLKEKGEDFEIVFISLDIPNEDFKQGLETMPWLAFPYKDKISGRLWHYFDPKQGQIAPRLVIIGQDGKTLNYNAVELIEEHGIDAYPFTQEKLRELEKAKQEVPPTLESLLVYGDKDFVTTKNGSKVPVSELVGKNILLYFSDDRLRSTHMLIKIYNEIKAKGEAFEVIFISVGVPDQASFDNCFSGMPWLALPFNDAIRKKRLERIFAVDYRFPIAIAIGPSGQVESEMVGEHAMVMHGAEAYPFTKERLEYLDERAHDMVEAWPEKLKHELHPEHELVLDRHFWLFDCNACEEMGSVWAFHCRQCAFYLHPKCALEKQSE